MPKKSSWIRSAAVLSFSNGIIRAIGFIWRIYLSRALGAEAMGLMQMVMPVQSLVLAFVCSGLPTAVSRTVAIRVSQSRPGEVRGVVRTALKFVLIGSAALTAGLLVFAQPIATYLLGQPRALLPLWVMAPCILPLGLGSVYDGYFFGVCQAAPAALSEIFEQLFRIVAVVAALTMLPALPAEQSAAVAIAGTAVGAVMRLVIIQRAYRKQIADIAPSQQERYGRLLFQTAFPLTLSRLLGSLMQSVNAILVPARLQAAGMAATAALAAFGRFSGMALPLIFLPMTVTGALSTMLIPRLADDQARGDMKSAQTKCDHIMGICMAVSLPLMLLLALFADAIGRGLYHEAEVGPMLALSALLLGMPQCVSHALSGILAGLNRSGKATRNMFIAALVQSAATWALVPGMGVDGAILAYAAQSIVSIALHLISLGHVGLRVRPLVWWGKPILASGAMAGVVWALSQALPAGLGGMALASVAGVGINLALLLATRFAPFAELHLRRSKR